ncbi:type II toxin-antitoxin system RelB family antitoxin [Hydrogenovibrio halophilus]|uniref:type II toxin-antitoxin system RelB family antitoxin n=1 Tax=Hydrogenovibrio halophilus TaxID=373391 RepID=UPI00036A4E89|nr:TraY domain-containing protein [Hydrogenovibrio halophilus]
MLAIRLPEDIESRLETMAKLTGRTKTFYAREALTMHLDVLEAHYLPKSDDLDDDLKDALLSWKAFEETGEQFDWDNQIKPWVESWFTEDEKPAPELNS